MLGGGDDVRRGRVDDHHAAGGGGGHVDVVQAHPGAGDDLEPGGGRQRLGVDLGGRPDEQRVRVGERARAAPAGPSRRRGGSRRRRRAARPRTARASRRAGRQGGGRRCSRRCGAPGSGTVVWPDGSWALDGPAVGAGRAHRTGIARSDRAQCRCAPVGRSRAPGDQGAVSADRAWRGSTSSARPAVPSPPRIPGTWTSSCEFGPFAPASCSPRTSRSGGTRGRSCGDRSTSSASTVSRTRTSDRSVLAQREEPLMRRDPPRLPGDARRAADAHPRLRRARDFATTWPAHARSAVDAVRDQLNRPHDGR